MITIRTTFAAALMCGAMALPAAAAGVGADAHGTAGMNTAAQNSQTNSSANVQETGSIAAPSTTPGVNGGINSAQQENPAPSSQAGAGAAQDRTAMNGEASVNGSNVNSGAMNDQPANGQTANDQSAASNPDMSKSAAILAHVDGDTSQKYHDGNRSADNQKEAGITRHLNQQAAQMASNDSQMKSDSQVEAR